MSSFSEQQEEIKMMTTPWEWPAWPFLPVKKHSSTPGEWPECALMADLGNAGFSNVLPVIYEGNLFNFGNEPFDKDKVIARYESIDALVADGWVVD